MNSHKCFRNDSSWMLLRKPSLNDGSGDRHRFWDDTSWPLTKGTLAVIYAITRLCFHVTVWESGIYADVGFTWSGSLLVYFRFSAEDKSSLVWSVEVEVAIKPRHSNSIGNISVVQTFCKHCSCRRLYYSTFYVDVPNQYFPQKKLSIQWLFNILIK